MKEFNKEKILKISYIALGLVVVMYFAALSRYMNPAAMVILILAGIAISSYIFSSVMVIADKAKAATLNTANTGVTQRLDITKEVN